MSIKLFPIQILLLFQIFPSLYSLSCKLTEKSSTPYYVGINFPTTARKGFSFTYFAENSKKLNPVEETIDSEGSLFQSTLEQLNDKSYQYIAWNDDPPAVDSGPASRAHAKAVIGVDPDSKTGFYFGHSFPNFPEVKNGKISAAIPNSANIYGQTFFCISLKTTEIEKMMETLAISRPNVYFSNIKEKDFPNLGALADHPNLPKGSDNFAIASVDIAGSNDKVNFNNDSFS